MEKIQGWKIKLLSKAGKEVLIKAVIQSMPTYAMSVFDLTKMLCDEISSMIGRFWWANQDNEKKIHWLSWEMMSKRKSNGGMGFRDVHCFNLAMLARQGWRLIHYPDSLCAQVLKARYFPHGNLLTAKEKSGISYAWRSILHGVQALQKGLIWRVGNGENINIWLDPWIPNGANQRPATPKGRTILTKVADLIDPNTGLWDRDLVEAVFWDIDANLILAIPIQMDQEDHVAWHPDTKGLFTVKSAYHTIKDKEELMDQRQLGESSNGASRNVQQFWSRLWKLKCQPKVVHFLWRLAHNSHPLRSNLKRKCMQLDTRCPMCSRFDEDGGHLFLKCKDVKQCWRSLGLEDFRLNLLKEATAQNMVHEIIKLPETVCLVIIYLLWAWWNVRNKVINGEKRN